MEHHKILYKDCFSQGLKSRQHSRLNRELQEANRNKQRRDRFQIFRNNVSPSITPQKNKILESSPDGKENLIGISQQENPNCTHMAKFVCKTTNPQKITKQEAFLKRYIEWKEKKKLKKEQQEVVKKPFVSTVNSGRQTTTSSSIVPRGHHKEFRPPIGLKMPVGNEKVEEHQNSNIKGRQSIYTVVPTPPRKNKKMGEKSLNKFPITRKDLPTNLHTQILNVNNLGKSVTKTTKPTTNNKKPAEDKNTNIRRSPAIKSISKVGAHNVVRTLEKTRVGTSTSLAQPPPRANLRPRALKMPPPPTKTIVKKPLIKKNGNAISGGTASTTSQSGAAGKMKNLSAKRIENVKQIKKSPLKSGGARLTQNLKAKKPLTCFKKVNVPTLQVNGKQHLKLYNNSNQQIDDMIIQTPKDFATLNPFEEFITSTKLKNSIHNLEDLDGVTSTETSHKRVHDGSSAKRNIMQEARSNMQVNAQNGSAKTLPMKVDGLENIVKKYNFIRYSGIANRSILDENIDGNEERKTNNDEKMVANGERSSSSNKENKTIANTSAIEEKSPKKFGPEERPVNYLSPFVSVTRGKVSLKKEKEKRNSIYLQNPTENDELVNESGNPSCSPTYSVEVRRTLEAVRYFRQQLQDETDRLHKLCNIWETYKEENLEQIQNANGEDMINVTIGQTRLLTSKKFMQFKGLIDRCESGATGIGAVKYDGSEGTKPITSVDLEGFWSMLGLQVDNLDNRFENLNRWKLNNWMDPDEVKPSIKNLTKVKKVKTAPAAKVKPNLALQQMLRKMQAEMRKNKKKNNEVANGYVILTPSKQKETRSVNNKNSTPRRSVVDGVTSRRLSIVVKDRKYFSPAATVISVTSLQRKSLQDSPKILTHIQNFNEALDTMESSLDLRKSVIANSNSFNSRRMSLNPSSHMLAMESISRKKSLDSVTTKDNAGFTDNKDISSKCKNLSAQSSLDSPVPTGRKSILKTPGTAKNKIRNVIFNEKLRMKKYNFLINEDGDSLNAANEDNNDTYEEDLGKSREDELQSEDGPQRTLTLRNRKIRLRPSCEIVIPLK